MNEGKMAMGFIFACLAMALGFLVIGTVVSPSDDGWESVAGVRVWTDPKTGCRYTWGGEGMKPLVGPDGLPDCARRQ
ncbi:MAG TPA: hypothetical protein VGU70_09770 [Methylobacterium sp.]|jgi:hypothetical protein|nr:hypothetical protein [Methylobacterium sp.]